MGMEEVRNARRILMKVVEDMRGSRIRCGPDIKNPRRHDHYIWILSYEESVHRF